MTDQALTLEQAQALGFSTIEECDEHQAWLDRQAEQAACIRTVVHSANEAGSPIIDVRNLSGK